MAWDNSIVEKARKYVKKECESPNSKYGIEPYEFHFRPVEKYAAKLAEKLGADIIMIRVVGIMHDIGSIIYGRKNHHLTGSKIVEKKLKEWGCPKDKIKKAKHCVFSHRGSQNIKRKSLEAQILADADTMANLENLSGMFKAAFVYEKLEQGEARISVRKKIINSWNKLSPEAKQIIRPRYEAAMLLLSENGELNKK